MAPIRPGLYNLRICRSDEPNLMLGGMYATAQAPELPVELGAQRPPGFREQVWMVIPEGEDTVLIQAAGMNDGAQTFMHNREVQPKEPIILSTKSTFMIRHERDIEGIGIYSLSLDTEMVGVTWYVGQNGNHEVALEPVPVIPDIPHPVWAFYPVNRD